MTHPADWTQAEWLAHCARFWNADGTPIGPMIGYAFMFYDETPETREAKQRYKDYIEPFHAREHELYQRERQKHAKAWATVHDPRLDAIRKKALSKKVPAVSREVLVSFLSTYLQSDDTVEECAVKLLDLFANGAKR